jgi:8-oxo-dGTP pyrophosphatase MutT (NUDIX family)
MNNFKIMKDNKEFWISRSMAVAAFIFTQVGLNFHDVYLLATKRGVDTPDNQGKWCCPCGYLDYNETIKNCVIREVKEETGYDFDEREKDMLTSIGIDSEPEGRQNVTIRYSVMVSPFNYEKHSKNINIEKLPGNKEINEIADVKWIRAVDIDNYKWCFNHDKILKERFELIKKIIQSVTSPNITLSF